MNRLVLCAALIALVTPTLAQHPHAFPDVTHDAAWEQRMNDTMQDLLFQFDRASEKLLGTKADVRSIHGLVLSAARMPHPEVTALRWISPSSVLVRAKWSEGQYSGGDLLFVVAKHGASWEVVQRYTLFKNIAQI